MFGPLAEFPLTFSLPILLAQAVAVAPGAAAKAPTFLEQWLPVIPYLAVVPIFYLLLVRPQQQQDRKRREMINQLKKNDKVLTAAGFYGTVVSMDSDADRVILKIDEDGKVRVAFARSGIVRVVTEGSEKK